MSAKRQDFFLRPENPVKDPSKEAGISCFFNCLKIFFCFEKIDYRHTALFSAGIRQRLPESGRISMDLVNVVPLYLFLQG
jgi:hypothetical protein